jgi:hypothetical protein
LLYDLQALVKVHSRHKLTFFWLVIVIIVKTIALILIFGLGWQWLAQMTDDFVFDFLSKLGAGKTAVELVQKSFVC